MEADYFRFHYTAQYKKQRLNPNVQTSSVADLGLSKSTIQQAWGLKHIFCGLSESPRVFLYASNMLGREPEKLERLPVINISMDMMM